MFPNWDWDGLSSSNRSYCLPLVATKPHSQLSINQRSKYSELSTWDTKKSGGLVSSVLDLYIHYFDEPSPPSQDICYGDVWLPPWRKEQFCGVTVLKPGVNIHHHLQNVSINALEKRETDLPQPQNSSVSVSDISFIVFLVRPFRVLRTYGNGISMKDIKRRLVIVVWSAVSLEIVFPMAWTEILY